MTLTAKNNLIYSGDYDQIARAARPLLKTCPTAVVTTFPKD
ncbi:hypothetical protein [Citrobacter farmeri]|nr:hypothetical protein [Citrobacter farmeri]MDB2179815.1 hypothetical protein [Citrobacter farmeri]